MILEISPIYSGRFILGYVWYGYKPKKKYTKRGANGRITKLLNKLNKKKWDY